MALLSFRYNISERQMKNHGSNIHDTITFMTPFYFIIMISIGLLKQGRVNLENPIAILKIAFDLLMLFLSLHRRVYIVQLSRFFIKSANRHVQICLWPILLLMK